MSMIACLAAFAAVLPVEPPDAFKAELTCVHRPQLRDEALCPGADEFAFSDGVTICAASTNALVRRAAADFADYLKVSMGVAAAVGEKGNVVVTLDAALAPRSCEIAVTRSGVGVRAADGRAAMQALFHLEDLMNLRRAPFIKVGTERRREKYETRMVHSGFGSDDFPDGYLGQVAHAGFGSILFYIDGLDVTRAGKTDVAALIDRAEAWGLGAYLYSALKAKVHPDDPKSAEVFERTYGAVGRAYPKAKGIVIVPESCEFPSRDPRAKQFSPRFPTSDYPLWSAAAEKAFRKGNPDADFIFWTYNFCWYPDEDRCAFIRSVTPTTAINVTFAVGGDRLMHQTRTGYGFPIEDYSICEPGPAPLFTCEAKAVKARGLRLFTMVNTAGRTWDFGCCPYEPVPQAWKRRYDAIEAARRDYGIVGLMESHHYGFVPNVVAELSKEAFVEGGMPFDRHLRAIAARDFGERHADEVVAVWADMSEAIRDYTATGENQYGPFRVGPAFPFNCYGKQIKPSEIPGWDGWICNPNYGWNIPWSGGESKQAKLNAERIRHEIRLFRPAAERFVAGAARLRGFAEELAGGRRKRALREAGVAEYIGRCFLTCANVKEATLAERDGDRAKVLRLAHDEYENARAALPLDDFDSRLGWEPSMRYRGARPQIEWKLRRMEELYGNEKEGRR